MRITLDGTVEVLCPVVIDADYIAVRIIAEQLLHLTCAAALHLRHQQANDTSANGGDAKQETSCLQGKSSPFCSVGCVILACSLKY